jgi:hypothetical protein
MAPSGKAFFTGLFRHNLDEKGRITIPSAWRAAHAEADVFLATPHPDGYVAVLPPTEVEKLHAKIAQLALSDGPGQDFASRFFSRTQSFSFDKQGASASRPICWSTPGSRRTRSSWAPSPSSTCIRRPGGRRSRRGHRAKTSETSCGASGFEHEPHTENIHDPDIAAAGRLDRRFTHLPRLDRLSRIRCHPASRHAARPRRPRPAPGRRPAPGARSPHSCCRRSLNSRMSE